jgi:plastocyanin
MTQNTTTQGNTLMLRWSVIVAIALIAFFGSYRFAEAANAAKQVPAAGNASPVAAGVASSNSAAGAASGGCCGSGASASGSAAGGCCGGSGTSAPATTGAAKVAGSVQKITVDGSKGAYDPNTIELKAGVPAEITFSNAGGCDGIVQSQGLGFSVDFTGGPQTVKLPALQPGTYTFACSMNMVTGTIVVK